MADLPSIDFDLAFPYFRKCDDDQFNLDQAGNDLDIGGFENEDVGLGNGAEGREAGQTSEANV